MSGHDEVGHDVVRQGMEWRDAVRSGGAGSGLVWFGTVWAGSSETLFCYCLHFFYRKFETDLLLVYTPQIIHSQQGKA
jgi:hypothetical protein